MTLDAYRMAYPDEKRAIQMVALGPGGDILVEYFQGQDDRLHMGASIASSVSVPDWHVSLKEVGV
jgi:hypothetical protein